jgi:hypothetical protein
MNQNQSDFPRIAQAMILYFAKERGDPSRWVQWDRYKTAVEREWPDFWAAWMKNQESDTDESFDAFQMIVEAHEARFKVNLQKAQ